MPPLTPQTDADEANGQQRRAALMKTTQTPAVPPRQVIPPSAARPALRQIQNRLIHSSVLTAPNTIPEVARKTSMQPLRDPVAEADFDHHTPKKYSIDAKGLQCLTFIREGDFDIVWPNVFLFTTAHLIYFYALYYVLMNDDIKTRYTWITCYLTGVAGGFGITAGAHRLWSHKSYDAKLPLRIFLMIGQCIAGQNSLYVWCRDHRVHHKFSETDGDPHNTNRGFFFAHVGWLLRKKHPEMIRKSKSLDFSDLLNDPVVKFQKDYYPWLYLIFAFIGPCLIPCYFWGESFAKSFLLVYVCRYMTSLHSTWFVNSTAHMFGDRPYNRHIEPRENYWVSYGAFGEGYHNYHHTFPRDYSTSELGGKLNLTKRFIDLMAFLGLAYNLRKMSPDIINHRKDKVHSVRSNLITLEE